MTGNEILTAFDEFTSADLDEAVALSLANQARSDIELEMRLACSKRLDISKTVQAGQTYLTPYALASDILVPAGQTIYLGTEPCTGIPFEQRELYKDTTGHFYVDLYGGNFHLTGMPTAGAQITFPYITKGTDIAADDNTVLKWPNHTHILVPMRMAQIWLAIDQEEQLNTFNAQWGSFIAQTKASLAAWDQAWKLAAIGGATPYGERERNTINTLG